jgi:hypothetical protein
VTKEELDDIRAAFERDYDPYFWRKLGKDEPSDPFRLAITHVGQLLELIREQGYEPALEPGVGHDARVICPAEVDVRDIDKALGSGWVRRLAENLRKTPVSIPTPTVPPGQFGCFICGGEHGNLPCPHTTVTCSTERT